MAYVPPVAPLTVATLDDGVIEEPELPASAGRGTTLNLGGAEGGPCALTAVAAVGLSFESDEQLCGSFGASVAGKSDEPVTSQPDELAP